MRDRSEKLLCVALIIFIAVLQINVPFVYAAGSDDSDPKEVGAWWIEDYTGTGLNNLAWCEEEAMGFYNALVNNGFTASYHFGNGLAWESDFENKSVKGYDYIYVDSCDFVYFAGHGSPEALYFKNNKDGDGQYTNKTHYTEADWGDQDLEWIFISASNVLQQFPSEWDGAFHNPKTLHGIAGFHDGPEDTEQTSHTGEWFVELAMGGWNIHEAWKTATILAQYPWDYAAMYAVKVHYWPPPPQPQIIRYYWNECLPGVGDGMYSDPPIPQWGVTVTTVYDKWQC